jgi:serine/threonine protein kinase
MMIGSKVLHYEITHHLGSGGMGVVYQATDFKLGRSVAIKVLPEAFTGDPERVARFQREARVLASLNHPNIAAIYGLEESGALKCLVMELAHGETLAARISRGRIPVDEAVAIARQIAEGLETAHERGVTHRDLKPANIIVSEQGQVKVLDFGLAKAFVGDAETSLSNSPTMMTEAVPGIILGTAAYMSPEQAKGKEADRSSDLWSFGCILYEMLSGHPPFEGETVNEILGGVLKSEPDWSLLPRDTPEALRRLLFRCLCKDVRFRLRDAHDACIEIEEARCTPPSNAQPLSKNSRERMEVYIWTAFALVGLIAIVQSVRLWRLVPYSASGREMRLEVTTPATTDPVSLAISPDGEKIVFVATSEDRPKLWLRSLESGSSRPMAGTEYAVYPFWSPDSRSVAFFAEGKLKRIDIDGGSVQVLAKAVVPAGGTWNRDGVILFPIVPDSAIFRVSAFGGDPIPTTKLQPQQTGHRFPQFLPDGRHFLYYVGGSPQTRGIYVSDLVNTVSRRLLDSDGPAVYASSGHLLFVRQGTLFAQSFDSGRLELAGIPHAIAEHVAVGGLGMAALSVSAAGSIAYRPGSSGGKRQLVWFDRSGNEIARIGNPETATPAYPSVSPDYRRAAVQRSIGGETDIWLIELGRGRAIRFTSDPGPEIAPIWSPDGERIVFSSLGKAGVFDLYQKAVTGTGGQELLATAQPKQATDWSRDGRFLLYRSSDPTMDWDIWALRIDGDRQPFPVVRTKYEERDAQFSPDGKWIAYQSNESGRFEIYVQPFPGPGEKSPVSSNGGAQVRWRRDGKELFYIALDGRLVAVPFASTSEVVETGSPTPLFPAHVGAVQDISLPNYIVSPDGQRFLIDTVKEESASPITVVLNWRGVNEAQENR